ncbi:transporter [Rhodoferax sp. GW822-FHT02A01]|uniref:transporter n=1 Tax=Rhodoferax sp. GW822-FHT02A01 TaxID=3141537 RepID=UPI00315DCF4D
MYKTLRTAAASMALLGTTLSSHAIDIDAGDYTALPEGTNVGLVYAQHAERNTLYAKGQQVPGTNGLDSDIGILRLIHFTKIGDYVVDPQVLLPFGNLKATGGLAPALGQANGTGDLIFAATVWTLNDPASRRYFGITPFLYAPTGTYDANKALNLGENRWKYALQAAYIHGFGDKWTVDVAADVTAYGENNDAGGGKNLKQDASSQVQAFLRYSPSATWDLRAGLSYAHTGATQLGGVDQGNASNVTKMQLGTAVFVGPKTQVLATWGRDLNVDNGFQESSRLNLRLLQVF